MTASRYLTQFEILEGPSVLTPKEIKQLLAIPDRRCRIGRRDAALLAVLLLGGLRGGEAGTLLVKNLENGPNGIVRIRLRTSKRKNHFRMVAIPAIGARAIRAWLAHQGGTTEWVFPGNLGRPLSVRAIEKRLAIHISKIGRGDLHLHSTRHSSLSVLMRETGDVFRVQRQAGHASANTTTQAYLSWSTREADENAAAMGRALLQRSHAQSITANNITHKKIDAIAFTKTSPTSK
jgi:integrase/recombinase XerD